MISNDDEKLLGRKHFESNSDEESKPKIVLPFCEICCLNEFKYKCPKCNIKTCSLICVKQHKNKNKCSGVKDKFNKNKELDEIDLYRDMNFINDAFNQTNKFSKTIHNLTEIPNEKLDKFSKDKRRKNFKKLCRKFRDVNLELCPTIIQKFAENKSFCDSREKKFYWTIKFIFLNVDNKKLEHLFIEPFDDSDFTLNKILEHMLQNKKELNVDLLLFTNQLQDEELKKIEFLYKLNVTENNEEKKNICKINNYYYQICDRNQLLKDILKFKNVYEYPEFYIKILN